MDGNDTGTPDPIGLAHAATERALETERSAQHERALTDVDQTASDVDQTASDADQTASDADQTASDADQTASERDDVDAERDQRSADRDQEQADQQRPDADAGPALDAYLATRRARDETRIDRLVTHAAREGTAHARQTTAAERDTSAAERDVAALRRDQRAAAREWSIAGSDLPAEDRIELLRAQAAATRVRATRARAAAAGDRERAARDRAAFAVEREGLERELRSAHVDTLTGALRREIGWLILAQEIERAWRGDGRLVVAYVDVDGMKAVNDRDGHAAGDRVLQSLVWSMRSHLRPYDAVIRYGGDEFVCGLPGAEIDEAERRFGLIGGGLRDELGVGISVGLATLTAVDTLAELTGRADAALVDAKRLRPH